MVNVNQTGFLGRSRLLDVPVSSSEAGKGLWVYGASHHKVIVKTYQNTCKNICLTRNIKASRCAATSFGNRYGQKAGYKQFHIL